MNAKSVAKEESENGAVIPFPNACAPAPVDHAPLDDHDRALLEAARWWLIKSRLTAKAVVEEACFLLSKGIRSEASAYATAFFRLLDLHAKRELRFFAVGVEEVTDDERWFLQLLNAAIDEDHDSVEALVAWRLDARAQRRGTFLMLQLGRFLEKIDLEKGENVFI